MYSKILAYRLTPRIANWVDEMQHGFVSHRDTTAPKNLTFLVFDVAATLGTLAGMILLVAENTLDRVSWSYFWETLAAIGFGSYILPRTASLPS